MSAELGSVGQDYTREEIAILLRIAATINPATITTDDPVLKAEIDAVLAKARLHLAQSQAAEAQA